MFEGLSQLKCGLDISTRYRRWLILMQHTCLSVLVILTVMLITLVVPAQAAGFSVDLAGHDYVVKAGDLIQNTVSITNITDSESSITVIPGEFVRNQEKKIYEYIEDSGIEQRSLLPWLTYTPSSATIPANGNVKINYQISVPNETSIKGTYWAVLYVKSDSSSEVMEVLPTDDNTPKLGVKFVYRYNVLITVTIEGSEPPSARFNSIQTEQSDMGPVFVVEIENSSPTICPVLVWIQLLDQSGSTVFESLPEKRKLLPESKRLVRLKQLSNPIKPGEYLALVIGDYGVPKLIGAQARVTITEEDAGRIAKAIAALETESSVPGQGESMQPSIH